MKEDQEEAGAAGDESVVSPRLCSSGPSDVQRFTLCCHQRLWLPGSAP